MSDDVDQVQSHEIPALLLAAKHAINDSERNLRLAAEHIAAVVAARARSQREVAIYVGKSPAWVNRLLKWREAGYEDDTAFGKASKNARNRARVQSAERAHQSGANNEAIEPSKPDAYVWSAGGHYDAYVNDVKPLNAEAPLLRTDQLQQAENVDVATSSYSAPVVDRSPDVAPDIPPFLDRVTYTSPYDRVVKSFARSELRLLILALGHDDRHRFIRDCIMPFLSTSAAGAES